jgi:hypothetical protein
MTYQVIFCGTDGVLIASDKLEAIYRDDGTLAPGNPTNKIRISAEFAWTYSGGDLAKVYAEHLSRNIGGLAGATEEELLESFERFRQPVLEKWRETTEGRSGPANKILFVQGSTQNIFRIDALTFGSTDKLPKRGIGGQISNTASFLVHRIYSPSMSVKALVPLAAYAIRTASLFDSSAVAGLDIAVYRNSEPEAGFRFLDAEPYMNCVETIEDEMRELFARLADRF